MISASPREKSLEEALEAAKKTSETQEKRLGKRIAHLRCINEDRELPDEPVTGAFEPLPDSAPPARKTQ